MTYRWLWLLTFALTGPACANEYERQIERFFAGFASGEVENAVNQLYSSNPWIELKGDAVKNVRNQLMNLNSLVGQFNGHVELDEVNVGNVFIHATHLALYDRQPVRMEFQFYRPKDQWIIYSFSFDVDWDDELEQGVRQRLSRGEP